MSLEYNPNITPCPAQKPAVKMIDPVEKRMTSLII